MPKRHDTGYHRGGKDRVLSVESAIARKRFSCDGSTVAFDIGDIEYENEVDIKASVKHGTTLVKTTLVKDVDFTISGATLTTTVAWASDYTLAAWREEPNLQEDSIPTSGPLAVAALTDIADRLQRQIQDLKDKADRSVVLDEHSSLTGLVLPDPTEAYFMEWVSNQLVNKQFLSTQASVSAFMATVLDDADAAIARATLGIIASVISIADAGGKFTATDVEAALEEVSDDISDLDDKVCPIGGIVAWHKSMTGTPALSDRWVECDGTVINDADSPMNGETLPDLNGDTAFIRGGAASSNTMQDHALEDHEHLANVRSDGGSNANKLRSASTSGGSAISPHYGVEGIDSGTANVAAETRPINMTMVWVMRIK